MSMARTICWRCEIDTLKTKFAGSASWQAGRQTFRKRYILIENRLPINQFHESKNYCTAKRCDEKAIGVAERLTNHIAVVPQFLATSS